MTRGRFKLSFLHIDDPEKSKNAPRHLRPTHLEHFYDDISHKFHVLNSNWVCSEKKSSNESMSTTLTSLADKRGADILILGDFASRKGNEGLSIAWNEALKACHASICIVRASMPLITPTWKIRWCMATDGSHQAAAAFCTLINCLIKPEDIVDVVLVSSAKGERDAFLKQYEDFLRERNVKGVVKVKAHATGTIPECLIAAAEEAEAEILVCGATTAKKLGSVSSFLMRHAPMATFVIKDHVDSATGSNRGSRLSGAAPEVLASELYRSASLRASRRATADSDWGVPESDDHLTSILNRAPSFTKRASMELDALALNARSQVTARQLGSVRRATDLETINSNAAIDDDSHIDE